MNRLIVGLLIVLTSTMVLARTTPPVLPAPVVEAQPALDLVGSGTLTFFVFRVYDAWLWAPGGQWSQSEPFVLDLRYSRALVGAQIADRSVVEIRKQGRASEAQLASWGAFMRQTFPDVSEGDRLTGEFIPRGATRFYFNGELRAEIQDPEFGPAFAAIWLAPETSEPRLRRALLGRS